MLIFTQFQTICCLRIDMSSLWKLGSRAAGNIAFYVEKQEKKIDADMISKYRNFSRYSYYSISTFFAWPQFLSDG